LNGERVAMLQTKADESASRHRAVDEHARAGDALPHDPGRPALAHRVLGREADQARGYSILSMTPLQTSMHAAQPMHSYCRPFADVDAGRADLHAQRAVDAVALADSRPDRALARAARLAALRVVADDQRVAVEHRALEARVRAHVLADLLAQVAGVAVSGRDRRRGARTSPTGRARRRRTSATSVVAGVK
jgi:hypothetical protein